ncbi:TonB-dependent receptor [Steroidobacter sp.]|uniref:TonB-dependent receptor n=1 Tax=Steroidobacter sp. TaxID=1978227 RepID=UPI001A4DE156|nr:TonB-dependent receptor [Steroidobacter sp.]MBL8272006.1 TonB-dependent receptor [Steroidobacter sp.]
MPSQIKRKSVLLAAACALSLSMAALADGPKQVDVPAGSLTSALKSIAEKFGVEIAFSTDQLNGMQTRGVHGEYTVERAVSELLQGTALKAIVHESGAILISGGKPESSSAVESENISEVLVQSRRPFTDQNVDMVRTIDDAQPYQILNSAKIEKSGAANIEDFLRQNLSMNAATVSNGAAATNYLGNTSTIDLRGLGANQTLILINGRRTIGPNFFGATGQTDINGIPLAAIDRIEALPTSASAIYGGAALGGALNVVLKHDYDGAEIKVGYDNPTGADAPRRSVDGVYGFKLEDGKTNVLISGHYSDVAAMRVRDRSELNGRIDRILRNNPALVTSSTLPYSFGTTPNITSTDGGLLTLRDGTPLNSANTFIPSGFTAASNPAALVANSGRSNFAHPDIVSLTANGAARGSQMGSEATVKSFGVVLRRQMSDNIELFGEYFYASNEAFSITNALFDNYTIADTAPTNPFQQAVNISIPANIAQSYRTHSTNRRAVIGAVMDLAHDWRAEADYTWSSSRAGYTSETAAFDFFALQGALDSGELNPFVDTLANPLDLSRYQAPFGFTAPSTLENIGLRFAGPLPELWAGQPTLAIGLERREEGLDDGYFHRVSPNFPSSGWDYYSKYLSQSQTVDSIYLETLFPLVAARNGVPGVRALDLQVAVRSERYEVGTGTGSLPTGPDYQIDPTQVQRNSVDYVSTNPTIGLRFKPIDSLTFRASYATAFLPPSFSQIVESEVSLPSSPVLVIDPQRGFTAINVLRITGGNPRLKPQESKSFNIGVIYEPEFLKNARFNLEYYRIEQQNLILAPNPQNIIDNEAQYPGRVQRAPVAPGDPYAVGPITLVDYSLINANESATDGFDLSASYRWRTQRYGAFNVTVQGTLIESYKVQNSFDSPLQEIVNEVAYGGPLKFRANAALNWDLREWSAGWTVMYYDSYPQYHFGTDTYVLAQGGSHVASQMYHDAYGSYTFAEDRAVLGDVTLQFGVKNIFNKAPSFDAYYASYLYSSPFGSTRMRTLWLSAAKRF